MSHRNARLTFHGRRLLVQRVRDEGMPVAHVAKAMGVSRQCAHRWVARFDLEGEAGLWDRSSRPHRTPSRTSPEIEARVLTARADHRRGQDWLGPELGVPARTVSRILRRHHVPRLCECDPLTGEVIRASKTTAIRYERDEPGELVHMDDELPNETSSDHRKRLEAIYGSVVGDRAERIIDAGHRPIAGRAAGRRFGRVASDGRGLDVELTDVICTGWGLAERAPSPYSGRPQLEAPEHRPAVATRLTTGTPAPRSIERGAGVVPACRWWWLRSCRRAARRGRSRWCRWQGPG